MTNAKQLRPLFELLTAQYPYLCKTGGRFLSKIPITHFLLGISIEQSSDYDTCWPRWTVTPLFVHRIFHSIELGTFHGRISRKTNERWRWSDQVMISDLITAIEQIAIPNLAYYGTWEGYATLPPDDFAYLATAPEDRMLVHIAMGELDAARAIWLERDRFYREVPHRGIPRAEWLREQRAAVEEPLFAGDRPALAKILHGWEAANVRGTAYERHWEPTPFPFEL